MNYTLPSSHIADATDPARVAAEADPNAPTQTGHSRNVTRVPNADGTQTESDVAVQRRPDADRIEEKLGAVREKSAFIAKDLLLFDTI